MQQLSIVILYLATIVGVNFGFAHTTPFNTALGPLPPMTFIVGIVFVLRDYVQRKIGHKVIAVMVTGCAISYLMASPVVATASLAAFIAAEGCDWLTYTAFPGKFQTKILASSIIGVLIDTMIFLPMVGLFSWPATMAMWASKMVAAVSIYAYYEARA